MEPDVAGDNDKDDDDLELGQQQRVLLSRMQSDPPGDVSTSARSLILAAGSGGTTEDPMAAAAALGGTRDTSSNNGQQQQQQQKQRTIQQQGPNNTTSAGRPVAVAAPETKDKSRHLPRRIPTTNENRNGGKVIRKDHQDSPTSPQKDRQGNVRADTEKALTLRGTLTTSTSKHRLNPITEPVCVDDFFDASTLILDPPEPPVAVNEDSLPTTTGRPDVGVEPDEDNHAGFIASPRADHDGPLFKDQVVSSGNAILGARSEHKDGGAHTAGTAIQETGLDAGVIANVKNNNRLRHEDHHQGPQFKDQARPGPYGLQQQRTSPILSFSDQDNTTVDPQMLSADGGSDDDDEDPIVAAYAVAEPSRDRILIAQIVPAKSKLFWTVLTFVILLAICGAVVAIICGTGECFSGDDNNQLKPTIDRPSQAPTALPNSMPTAEPSLSPSVSPTEMGVRANAITAFINSVALSGRKIFYSTLASKGEELTPEEKSVLWLIEDDLLRLTVSSAANLFRLRQRYALGTLYLQTPWVETSGFVKGEECSWFGVSCIQEDFGDEIGVQNVVSAISLGDQNFQGKVPNDIALLTNLSVLDLQDNNFFGSIPETITLLTSLLIFDVNKNYMTGTVPHSIGSLSSLLRFSIYDNYFNGALPDTIGEWSVLTYFSVDRNRLSGSLPSSIGNWTSLEEFYVNENSLTGTLPESIGHWSSLQKFWIYDNLFSGTLPDTIGEWSDLTYFSAGQNILSGSLPSSIGNWNRLSRFYVYLNPLLTGTLPEPIGQWSGLEKFRVYDCLLSGTIPQSITNWKNIEVTDFHGNRFNGTMPSGICALDVDELVVDCQEVVCSCCTFCGEDLHCVSNDGCPTSPPIISSSNVSAAANGSF